MDQLQSILDQITPVDVAKWALIVLVAGFIGQFGRKFAEYLIDRAKRKKAAAPSEKSSSSDTVDKGENDGRTSLPEPASPATPAPTSKETKERDKARKKLNKALAKQKKKAASSE